MHCREYEKGVDVCQTALSKNNGKCIDQINNDINEKG